MEYSFHEVMGALKRFVKDNNISGSIFAELSFCQMMNQTEEFEAKIMEWAKEHPEPKKKTWGEVLCSLGLLDREYITPTSWMRQGVDDTFYFINKNNLNKHVPDEIALAIDKYLNMEEK